MDDRSQSVPYTYAAGVRDGSITAGWKVRAAVDRFFKLLERDDVRCDHEAGMHVILFFEKFLRHTVGDLAGQPFILAPHQQFTYYCLFAFKIQNVRGQWVRLYRQVYEKVARKNGKTAALAGLALYCMVFDDENGAEVYVAAAAKHQSKILWEQARQFIHKNPELIAAGWDNTISEIRHKGENATFKHVSKEAGNLDGLKPSFSILDEYHAHPTDAVKEVFESAMGNRSQPIQYIITTAGFNLASPCKQFEDVCDKVLRGDLEDDRLLIVIHDLDDDDDWNDPIVWVKANPNLDVSVYLDYLKGEYEKAINQPSKIPNFKTKHLNMWVDAPTVWIAKDKWGANAVESIPMHAFAEGSIGACDLSSTTDFTAFTVLSRPDADGVHYLKAWLFCPEDKLDERAKLDRAPYRAWRDQGHIIATPGNVIDYEVVRDTIVEQHKQHNVERIEFDQWNAGQMVGELEQANIEVSFFKQGIATISYPTKQFEKLVIEGKIKHEGNPAMAWMLSGCVLYRDPNDNIKVHKGQSHKGTVRVDGIVASIMALGGLLTDVEDNTQSSYNDGREIFI